MNHLRCLWSTSHQCWRNCHFATLFVRGLLDFQIVENLNTRILLYMSAYTGRGWSRGIDGLLITPPPFQERIIFTVIKSCNQKNCYVVIKAMNFYLIPLLARSYKAVMVISPLPGTETYSEMKGVFAKFSGVTKISTSHLPSLKPGSAPKGWTGTKFGPLAWHSYWPWTGNQHWKH